MKQHRAAVSVYYQQQIPPPKQQQQQKHHVMLWFKMIAAKVNQLELQWRKLKAVNEKNVIVIIAQQP